MPTKRTHDIAQAAATAPQPRAHLTPETGWLNDPHGVYYLDGRHQVFFQRVPDSPQESWGRGRARRIAMPVLRLALVVIFAAPILIMFVAFQRSFVASIAGSGVKG